MLPPPMLLAPFVVATFQELGISVSTWTHGVWRALYWEHDVIGFEVEFATQPLRAAYNDRCLAKVQRERRAVRGAHAGYHDLFVPVEIDGEVRSVLVAGPFATRRPSSADVLADWAEMTRSQGSMSDPTFLRYVRKALATLTLEGPLTAAFEKLMTTLARLASNDGDPTALAREAESVKEDLLEARACERMWDAVGNMLDPRTSQTWLLPMNAGALSTLGMRGPPGHAVVGLTLESNANADPLETMLRRAAFQRACVAFGRRGDRVLVGRVADNGVVLLADRRGSRARVENELVELCRQVRALARGFGLRLHAGIASVQTGDTLPTRYRLALAAAELASRSGAPFELAARHVEPTTVTLRRLRRELGAVESSTTLTPTFDRYVEAVLAASGYELEATRARLDAGLERLLEPLLESGALDPRSFEELFRTIPDETSEVPIASLVEAYRHVVNGVERALLAPTSARQERNIRRALQFMREHLAEPLLLAQVARVAGFAPDHFSVLIKRQLGKSFSLHLQSLRLERAKQLLSGTALQVSRVGQMCGFKSRTSFQRLFRQSLGTTPAEYQRRARAR